MIEMKWLHHNRSTEHGLPETQLVNADSGKNVGSDTNNVVLLDYFKFVLFSILLVVPVYAMVKSILSQNWLMLVIDVLLVPVGFIHGVLLLLGLVS